MGKRVNENSEQYSEFVEMLYECLENIEHEPFSPFLVSGKVFSIIKKMNIRTCLGNQIKLYDQLAFTFIWYQTKEKPKVGDCKLYTSVLIFKKEEVKEVAQKVAQIMSFMEDRTITLKRVAVNLATVSIYKENGLHMVDILKNDYCRFLADANHPDKIQKSAKYIRNDGGAREEN